MSIKIIYIYDALCGWCYGFSPVMKKFFQNYQTQFEFEVLSGGMVLGDRVGPIGKVAAYIRLAYPKVESRSGVEFGKAFTEGVLKEGTQIFSSELPSRAMTILKQEKPASAVLFADHLLKALYQKGWDLNQEATYLKLFKDFGLNAAAMVKRLKDLRVVTSTNAEFLRVSNFGVSGFPTVLAKVENQYYAISRGYTSYEQLAAAAQRLLQIAKH